uniref:Uncharacterized protein n=1 Tax=Rhizophora mucronata TaxID=61149 RepID=A0A2P2IVE3_RHIMU
MKKTSEIIKKEIKEKPPGLLPCPAFWTTR